MGNDLFFQALKLVEEQGWTVYVNQYEPTRWEIRSHQGQMIEGEGRTLATALVDALFKFIAVSSKGGRK